jgi:UDP-N-acetylglucosamine acyltransferase
MPASVAPPGLLPAPPEPGVRKKRSPPGYCLSALRAWIGSQTHRMSIHSTAIVDKSAELGNGVTIGPYCVVGPHVQIGADTALDAYVHILKWTAIGKRCHFHSHSVVGGNPQDLKYNGEKTQLTLGDDNTIREFVTLSRGTAGGGGVTTVGNNNLIMAYSHVAHDCHVGNKVIMDNAATLAGHVTVQDNSTIGAFSAIHQFCRVGEHAFIGGFSVITRDALPYIKTVGSRNDAKIYGINTIGLQRKGISEESIEALKQAYRILFRSQLNTGDALKRAREKEWSAAEVETLLRFIETSERGFIR